MTFAPSQILSHRQRHFYVDQCSLLRPVAVFGTDGVATGTTWEVAALGVPCHFEIRPSQDEQAVFGRYQADNMNTLDILHLGEFQECGPEYLVHNLTKDPDGSPSSNYGFWWEVRSIGRFISRRSHRQAGKRQFYVYRLAKEPPGAPEIEALAIAELIAGG